MNSFAPIFLTMLATGLSTHALRAAQPYTIVDTGQTKCYDNRSEIAPPKPGQPFYGQDAQFQGHPSSYTLSADGLTVRDNVTGLTWQRSPDTDGDGALDSPRQADLGPGPSAAGEAQRRQVRRLRRLAPAVHQGAVFALRRPRHRSQRPYQARTLPRLTPFIDTKFFKFAYGDTRTGERVIDSQYASSTRYVGKGAARVRQALRRQLRRRPHQGL